MTLVMGWAFNLKTSIPYSVFWSGRFFRLVSKIIVARFLLDTCRYVNILSGFIDLRYNFDGSQSLVVKIPFIQQVNLYEDTEWMGIHQDIYSMGGFTTFEKSFLFFSRSTNCVSIACFRTSVLHREFNKLQ